MPWTHYFTSLNDATTPLYYGAQTTLYFNRIGASDPVTGTHQPYGWDQMTALYGYHKVVGFQCKMTITNSTSGNRAVTSIRSCPAGDTSDMSASSLLGSERPGVTNIQTVTGAGEPPVFHFKSNIWQHLGITKQQFDADISQFGATVTANPNFLPSLKIATAGDSVSVGVRILIEAVFTIDFWQRTTQSTS